MGTQGSEGRSRNRKLDFEKLYLFFKERFSKSKKLYDSKVFGTRGIFSFKLLNHHKTDSISQV